MGKKSEHNLVEIDPIQFSIIVPVFCVEKYLPKAIESVLAQNVSDWELILVDDGSPDRCGEICDRYAAVDNRIRVIHKPNGGAASARQAGVEHCRGEYILTLDSDDYWDSDLLSNLKDVISQYHPDCILFGFRKVTEDGKHISEMYPSFPAGIYREESLQKVWNGLLYLPSEAVLNTGTVIYSQCTSVFRREIVEPYHRSVPKNVKMGEDAAVTIAAICHCKSVCFLDKIMYNYLVRRTSASFTFFNTTMEETIQLLEYFQKYATQVPKDNLSGFVYRMADKYWISAARNLQNYREYKSCAKKALQIMPKGVMQDVASFPLCLKYKLRFLAAKNHLWFLYWLTYHRR